MLSLQDSIGGNAKTVIVANISPSEACLQETLSTLGFAARARKIVNKVTWLLGGHGQHLPDSMQLGIMANKRSVSIQ
jgi:kinesin family protein 15